MKPLQDLTVLEFSTMITASLATMMMAEQGARVIKVEPIEDGDPMRHLGTAKGGISALFANCNRGKSSIRVNLKDAAGQALIRELAAGADVVIHNFRPGVMDGLGLGADALRAAHPRLIYVAISGFGKAGPFADAPAYDPIIQAHAGLTASQGVNGSQAFVRNLVCDKITAYTAVQAVTAALYVREKTGEGQLVDLSMLDAALFFIFPDGFMNHTLTDDDVDVQPLLADLLYRPIATKDGTLTCSAATVAQQFGMLRALNKESIFADPRFDSVEKILADRDAYLAEIAAAFLDFDTDTILERLQENDVPAARCLSYEEVVNHPQLAPNDTMTIQQHPLMGAMRAVKLPARFGGERLPLSGLAPAHGEHTRTVLEAFGVDEARIGALFEQGTVA